MIAMCFPAQFDHQTSLFLILLNQADGVVLFNLGAIVQLCELYMTSDQEVGLAASCIPK
jgi:hypothetical protein